MTKKRKTKDPSKTVERSVFYVPFAYGGWVEDLGDGTCRIANSPLLGGTLKYGDRVDLFSDPTKPWVRPWIGYRVYPEGIDPPGINHGKLREPTEEELKEEEAEDTRRDSIPYKGTTTLNSLSSGLLLINRLNLERLISTIEETYKLSKEQKETLAKIKKGISRDFSSVLEDTLMDTPPPLKGLDLAERDALEFRRRLGDKLKPEEHEKLRELNNRLHSMINDPHTVILPSSIQDGVRELIKELRNKNEEA